MSSISPRLKNILERERVAESPVEQLMGQWLTRFGISFVRQEPIGPYFADIYIPERKTVIECDGKQHVFQQEHDERRDRYMMNHGIRVIRISGVSIFRHATECANQVLKILDKPMNACVIRLDLDQESIEMREEEPFRTEWDEITPGKIDWE